MLRIYAKIFCGKANALWGRYFHDSGLGLSMTDALFDLNYLALKVGQSITSGATSGALAEVQVTANASGTITVDGTPADFLDYGKCGWIAKPGSDEWTTFNFDGDTKTSEVISGLIAGDTYCVKYMNEVACDELVIPSDFVPSEVSVILKGNLYRAGANNDVETSSVAGTLQVEIPRFQLDAEGDLSLTSSGAAQVALSGQALASESGASCEGGGTYARIKDIRLGAHWYDNLTALAIEGSDAIELVKGTTKAVKVFGVFSNGTSRLLEPAKLNYNLNAGSATGTTINNATGVITAGTTTGDDGVLTITVTDKPGVEVVATVAVTD